MLAIIRSIGPRDEIETMLAAQMAAIHMATMTRRPPRPGKQHPPAGQCGTGAQQAGQDVCGAGGSAEPDRRESDPRDRGRWLPCGEAAPGHRKPVLDGEQRQKALPMAGPANAGASSNEHAVGVSSTTHNAVRKARIWSCRNSLVDEIARDAARRVRSVRQSSHNHDFLPHRPRRS